MVQNSFLMLLFSIIIIFPFTIAQTLDDYYNGNQKKIIMKMSLRIMITYAI